MNKSFLNSLLPRDEYKKTKMLYFMAEAFVVNVVLLFTLMGLYYFVGLEIDLAVTLFLSSVLLIGYPYFRYILSGMEHTEVSTEREYKRTRREVVIHAILSGIFFGIAMLVIKGVPNNLYDGMDYIFIPILFTLFYLLFDYVSLRKSYNKNKELD